MYLKNQKNNRNSWFRLEDFDFDILIDLDCFPLYSNNNGNYVWNYFYSLNVYLVISFIKKKKEERSLRKIKSVWLYCNTKLVTLTSDR